MEDTSLVALETVYNAREAESGMAKQDLLQFVEEVSFKFLLSICSGRHCQSILIHTLCIFNESVNCRVIHT